MYYLIERTFLTDADGHSDRQYDLTPYIVLGDDAGSAVGRFMAEDQATMYGPPSDLPGDKATGTGTHGKRFFVVFAQRADEGIQGNLPPAKTPRSDKVVRGKDERRSRNGKPLIERRRPRQ